MLEGLRRRLRRGVPSAERPRSEAFVVPEREAAVRSVEALLFRHDPIGLDVGNNPDEYRPEAETIVLRRDEVQSRADAQRVTHEEFVRWFGADTAGPPDQYDEIARELWRLWRTEPG